MNNNDPDSYSVGDALVNFGQIYLIFKVTEDEDPKIYFKPFYENNTNRGIVRTIPQSNLVKTCNRKPLSQEKLKRLLDYLSKTDHEILPIEDLIREKEKLNKNDAFVTARILKKLWFEKQTEAENFKYNKIHLMKTAIKRLAQELAYIQEQTLEETEKQLEETLKQFIYSDSGIDEDDIEIEIIN
jgi:RNA polymerase-interacting CarD/CdnL/TRCF family regulator